MQVILQHRENGLYLGDNAHWESCSRNALSFASAREALRFAARLRLHRQVHAVFRYEQQRHYILLPLMDESRRFPAPPPSA